MVCIWTTSVQLTWGVASLRAIIMNMHIWSSRLLKPKLQAAVSKVSRNFQVYQHQLPNKSLPAATLRVPGADGDSLVQSSPITHIEGYDLSQPRTPERHITLASPPRIDTPIPSTSPEDTSPRHKNRVEEASNSQSKTNFGFGGRSTTRTPGLFGRATGGGGSIFGKPGPGKTTSIVTGSRYGTYKPQNANKTGSQLSLVGTNDNQGFGRITNGAETNNDHTNNELYAFPKTMVNASHANGSNKTCPPFGSTTKPTFASSSNTASSGFSVNSDSVASGTWTFTKAPENTGLESSGEETSPAAVIDPNVTELATAFGCASLQDVFRDDVPIFGTANTPSRIHIEEDTTGVKQHYQSVTFRSPYVNHSLEELRMADYDGGRRYCSPSDHSDQIFTLDGNTTDSKIGATWAPDSSSTSTNRSVASADLTTVIDDQIGAFGQSSTFGGFGPSNNITNTSALGSKDTSHKGGLFGGGITTNATSRSRQSTGVLCAEPNSTSGHSFDPQPRTVGLFGDSSATTTSATSRGLFGGSNIINRGSNTSPSGRFGPGVSSVGTDNSKSGYGAKLNTGSKPAPFGAGGTNVPDGLFGGGSMVAFGQSKNRSAHTGGEFSETPRPGNGASSTRYDTVASDQTENDRRLAHQPSLNTPTRIRRVDNALDEPESNSDDDGSSDSSSRRSSLGRYICTPISGDRLIDLPTLQEIVKRFERGHQRTVLRMAEHFINPNGTYSVPLHLVVKSINEFLDPKDHIC